MALNKGRAILLLVMAAIALAVTVVVMTPRPVQANHFEPGFVVVCNFRKHATIDPVTDHATHLHAIYGGNVQSYSTTAQLINDGSTTCNVPADKAGYWIPAVSKQMADGSYQRLTPSTVHVYYRPGKTAGVNRSTLPLYPYGLELLIGNPYATGPQPTSRIAYTCSGSGGDGSFIVSTTFVNCYNDPDDPQPTIRVIGPDCYDGRAKSGNYQSHTAYSNSLGQCPSGYHRGLVIRMDFRFPAGTNVSGAQLSNGAPYKMHADFMDGWNTPVLRELVEKCIRDGTGCDIPETKAIAAT